MESFFDGFGVYVYMGWRGCVTMAFLFKRGWSYSARAVYNKMFITRRELESMVKTVLVYTIKWYNGGRSAVFTRMEMYLWDGELPTVVYVYTRVIEFFRRLLSRAFFSLFAFSILSG